MLGTTKKYSIRLVMGVRSLHMTGANIRKVFLIHNTGSSTLGVDLRVDNNMF